MQTEQFLGREAKKAGNVSIGAKRGIVQRSLADVLDEHRAMFRR